LRCVRCGHRHGPVYSLTALERHDGLELDSVFGEAVRLVGALSGCLIRFVGGVDHSTDVDGITGVVVVVAVAAVGDVAGSVVDGDGVATVGVELVVTRTAGEGVGAFVAVQHVRPCVAHQDVVAEAARQLVVAAAAVEPVVSSEALDDVIPVSAEQQIRPGVPKDRVVARTPVNVIGALPTEHGIVTAAGGTITVDSRPGEGSLFAVTLPVVEETAESFITNDAPLPGGSEHILVVDDEVSVRRMMQHMLRTLGYSVTTLPSGAEALAALARNGKHFDLLITDQMMPEMRGTELARQAMDFDPRLPVILCTGFSDQVTPREAVDMGIAEFMMKPIVRRNLAESVRRALGDRDTPQETLHGRHRYINRGRDERSSTSRSGSSPAAERNSAESPPPCS